MAAEIRVIGVDGIPEARPGDDPAELVVRGIEQSGLRVEDGDVVVVTHKLVSKSQGRLVSLETVEPSPFAREIGERYGKDPRHVEVVLRESARVVRMDHGLIIAETRHGFICANAGVDASNVAGTVVSMLPLDPDGAARDIRRALGERYGADVAVVITDSFGRPWRRGIVNIAIGAAGIRPLLDYRGQYDEHGYELRATVIAVADEIASASELVMGKLDRRPVAIVRGYRWESGDEGAAGLVMDPTRDLFR
ncbi:MAG TPA: coenzyme F420-0:L-glutamate ligase [Thermomicrobiaceae bacterium]|nr:coenzyme F420-0:L-glutamate ligase [Thermomicrobiaceae bacterium]